MSRECGPGGGFLVRECDHLSQLLDFFFGRKYFDMHPVDLDFFQLVCFLVGQNVRFVWVNFEPLRFCTFFEVRDHSLELFQRGRHHEHVVSITQVGYAVSFFVTQFDAQALFVPSFNVFLLPNF